jgi:DNA-binding transcriptional MerR regulator
MSEIVTIFRNIRETETAYHRSVAKVLGRIKDGASKDLVTRIRKENDKASRNEMKKELPAVCFSGIFNKRNDSAIQQHSGFICLDFDGYATAKDMKAERKRIEKDRYVYSVFTSPSGNGLKVLIKIPQDPDNHTSYFNALEKHFNSEHFDKTCKNVSRVCYESYDPMLYLNEKSELWTGLEETEHVEVEVNKDQPTIPITDDNKVVDILVKWWTKKYGMVDGERNANIFKLAMAFNDFGINKSLASHILRQYEQPDFPASEIDRTLESAYAHTQKHGTRYYEDTDRITNIKAQLKRGVSKKEIRSQLKGEVESDVVESVLERVERENEEQTFWLKTEKGVIKIVPLDFKTFLEDHGFYKYAPEGSKNYVFVKVTNNLIDHTSEKEIKDFILGYLLDIEDKTIYNFFADAVRYFREEFLTLLSTIDVYFMEDTSESAYLYYRNCAVRITPKGVDIIDYLDLGGYVWQDHIIDRNFTECKHEGCDYQKFISNICAGDEHRTATMESTIGYMLHGYKNLSYSPAVILNDEVISDNPEGGTGKGLFMNALSHMKKLIVIDGKAFAFERSFPYQLVSADTQILCFDDVKKNFDFERLFSVVTEGLTLEKKNKDAIKIPFEKSPKIGITTNYAIKGAGNSFARRKWELELHQYYNKSFTPLEEFKRHFFADWDDDEWCAFDNYMVSCLQSYLGTGLVESKFINLGIRQLSAETSHDFIEWCGLVGGEENPTLDPYAKLYKDNLYLDFIEQNPDYAPKAKLTISRTRFYKWLTAYCIYRHGIPPEEGRDSSGRWMRIRTKHDAEEQTELTWS